MIVGNMYYFVECVMICACFIVQLCAFAPPPFSLNRPIRVFSVCVGGVCARRTMGLRLRRYVRCYHFAATWTCYDVFSADAISSPFISYCRFSAFIPTFFGVSNCLNGALQPGECQT